ncbi:hypothetical protein FA09DRAFT_283834, partial [Tilletiopsis washingtonensis]
MRAAAAVSLLLAAAASSAAAFEISFPNSTSYWVACKENTVNWSANSSDPSIFSVALINSNQTSLRGSYLIGNSLSTANGTAQLRPNCIPEGSYDLLFVNASNYALDNPEVYYRSASFQLRGNETELEQVTPNTGAFNNQPSSSSGSNGASSSTTSGAPR